jgi:hypothetical protein
MAGLSPSEARGRERSDLDSPAAGATMIGVQVGAVRPRETAGWGRARRAWQVAHIEGDPPPAS